MLILVDVFVEPLRVSAVWWHVGEVTALDATDFLHEVSHVRFRLDMHDFCLLFNFNLRVRVLLDVELILIKSLIEFVDLIVYGLIFC